MTRPRLGKGCVLRIKPRQGSTIDVNIWSFGFPPPPQGTLTSKLILVIKGEEELGPFEAWLEMQGEPGGPPRKRISDTIPLVE